MCPDDEVLAAALAAAHKIAKLPRQAVEATKRVLNLHVERAVLATIDFAMAAETESFDTPDLRANVDRFLEEVTRYSGSSKSCRVKCSICDAQRFVVEIDDERMHDRTADRGRDHRAPHPRRRRSRRHRSAPRTGGPSAPGTARASRGAG